MINKIFLNTRIYWTKQNYVEAMKRKQEFSEKKKWKIQLLRLAWFSNQSQYYVIRNLKRVLIISKKNPEIKFFSDLNLQLKTLRSQFLIEWSLSKASMLHGAGVQQLKALAILQEDPSSFLRTFMIPHNSL